MNWTMPYPWSSRSDSVRRINMSSEPGNESFFCALRPIPRILSLRRRDETNQVKICKPSRRKTISGCSRAPNANGSRGKQQAFDQESSRLSRCGSGLVMLSYAFSLRPSRFATAFSLHSFALRPIHEAHLDQDRRSTRTRVVRAAAHPTSVLERDRGGDRNG